MEHFIGWERQADGYVVLYALKPCSTYIMKIPFFVISWDDFVTFKGTTNRFYEVNKTNVPQAVEYYFKELLG